MYHVHLDPGVTLRHLGTVLRCPFLAWIHHPPPKKDITLDPAVPPQPSIQKASPTGPSMTPPQPSLQKAASSVPVEKTPKEQEKHAAVSVPESSHRKTRSGQVVQNKSKSKIIKPLPPPNPRKYSSVYLTVIP